MEDGQQTVITERSANNRTPWEIDRTPPRTFSEAMQWTDLMKSRLNLIQGQIEARGLDYRLRAQEMRPDEQASYYQWRRKAAWALSCIAAARTELKAVTRELQSETAARNRAARVAARETQEHICPVPGCGAWTPSWLVMCEQHWALVPQSIKHSVKESYRSTERQSEDYLLCARDAVTAASVKERAVKEKSDAGS